MLSFDEKYGEAKNAEEAWRLYFKYLLEGLERITTRNRREPTSEEDKPES